MDVASSGPIPVASLVWQRGHDVALTVVCKATYRLVPGEASLAEEQEGLNDDDNHWDDDPSRSLYFASDLAPWKPRADVLLVGHAFAPHRTPTRSVAARIAVCGVEKTIEVFCDRAWSPQGMLREGAPFVSMPLRYERAAGGPDTWNPVGIRPDAPLDKSGAVALPNLQPTGTGLRQRGDRIEPAGFGPIAPSWPSRAAKLAPGTAWSPGRWQLSSLPHGLDPGFFNVAPPDQQVAEVRGDETLVLENLHPTHPRLTTRLPGLAPRAFVERGARPGSTEEVALACDTLWIDTDRAIVTLTWRGQVRLAHAMEPGRVVVRFERTESALPRTDASAGARGAAPSAQSPVPTPVGSTQALPPSTAGSLAGVGASGSAGGAAGQGGARHATAALDPAQLFAAVTAQALPFQSTPSSTPLPAPPMPAIVMRQPVQTPAPESPWVAETMRAPADPVPALTPTLVPQALRPEALLRAHLTDLVTLVWHDPACAARLSRRPAWRELLDRLQDQEPDADVDDPALSDPPDALEDRRAVFEILAGGDAIEVEGAGEALADAAREDRKLVPPLVLIEGELVPQFDDLAALRATLAAMTPLAGGDAALEAAIASATDLAKTPWLEGSGAVIEGILTRLREAYAHGKRALPLSQLEQHVERALLEQRRYQRRAMFGEPCLRALLVSGAAASGRGGAAVQVPAYMPEHLASRLPMFQRFRARLIAEAHPRQDQHEVHPCALRVLAVGHVVPAAPRR